MNFRKCLIWLALLAIVVGFLPGSRSAQAASYSITLIDPNGGDLLMGGSKYDIEWVASGPSGGGCVKLRYSIDNGTTWTDIDCVTVPLVVGEGSLSYTWEVPNVSSSHCKINIIWLSSCTGMATVYAADVSDAEFTMTPVQTYFSTGGDIKVLLAGGAREVNLSQSSDTWEYQPSASADGEMMAFTRAEVDLDGEPIGNTSEIWLMNSEGESEVRVTSNNVEDIEPAIFSGSESLAWKVVFRRFDPTRSFSNIYMAELIPGWFDLIEDRWIPPHISETQLTSGDHQDGEPCFSPDGAKIVFSSNRDGNFQLYTLSIGNPASVNIALPGVPPYTLRDQRTPDWSPDGNWFACSMQWGTESEIFIADAWGPINTRRVAQVTDTPGVNAKEVSPSWSPDSQEIEYVKRLTGADVTPQELWAMKLNLDDGISVAEDKRLKDLGWLSSYVSADWIGDPCWRCLEGLRIPDVGLEGRVNNPFDVQLEVFGGLGPFIWSLSGTLPDGLSFSTGRISGTPTQAVKNQRFEVEVNDNLGLSGQRSFTITVRSEHDLEIITAGRFLPPAVEGAHYTTQVQFGGGLSPYQVTVESPIYGKDLPMGLTWNQSVSGGLLTVLFDSPPTGLPNGRYKVKVEVVDDLGDVAAGFFDLNVLKIDWNVKDIFGENFDTYVWGLPEESGMERFISGVSIEAGGIEISVPISSISPSGDHYAITAPYPDDFSPWRSLFTPGNCTVIGKLKLRVNLEGNEATVTTDFPIHGYMFRRDRGFSFRNFSSSPIEFADFADFFGWEDTMWPWGAPRLVPWILWNAIAIGQGGNCTGMSVSAMNIADDIAKTWWEDYPNLPHAAALNSQLAKPDMVLEDYIRTRQWWIVSMKFIRLFSTVIPASSNWDRWSNKMLEDIGNLGFPCYITMFHDHTGNAHTVTAYAREDLADGTVLIRVYDSNKPFVYTETSDSNSAIYINPSRDNAWIYYISDCEVWSNDWILAIPIDLLRGDPQLPSLLDLPELIADWTFFAVIGSAGTTQIADDEGHESFASEGQLNIDPATGMPYCLPLPLPANDAGSVARMYYMPADRSYQLDVSGTESGEYDFLYMPIEGMMITLNASTSAGSKDNITFNPAELSTMFSAAEAKTFGCKIVREFESEGKVFTLDNIGTGGSGGVSIAGAAEGDSVTIHNDGEATSYDLKIEYLCENGTQTLEGETITLGHGETQLIICTSWGNLAAKGVEIKRDIDGDGTWDKTLTLSAKGIWEEANGLGIAAIAGIVVAALAVIAGLALFIRRRLAQNSRDSLPDDWR